MCTLNSLWLQARWMLCDITVISEGLRMQLPLTGALLHTTFTDATSNVSVTTKYMLRWSIFLCPWYTQLKIVKESVHSTTFFGWTSWSFFEDSVIFLHQKSCAQLRFTKIPSPVLTSNRPYNESYMLVWVSHARPRSFNIVEPLSPHKEYRIKHAQHNTQFTVIKTN